MIDEKTKKVLFKLLKSHGMLSQAEYKRNPSYNDSHFSHIAEDDTIKFLEEENLFDEFVAEEGVIDD